MTNFQLVGWMFSFLKPVKLLVFLACLWLTAMVAVEVFAVRQTGEAVNHIKRLATSDLAIEQGFWTWFFSSQPEATGLRNVIFILLGLAILLMVFRYLREVSAAQMSMEQVFYMREAVYDKLQRVGFGFHDAISSGQLINRALTDLGHVRNFNQTATLVTAEIVLIVGAYITLMASRSIWVAGLALIPLPIWTWYIYRYSRRVQPVAKQVMEADDRNVTVITENIAGVHVVKAFATADLEIKKYNANCDDYFARVMKRIRMSANFTPVIRAIGMSSHLSLFLATAILMIKGKLDAGDFLILGSAMGAILSRLQQVATISDQYQNAVVSARRLYEVLHAPPTVPEKEDAKPLPPKGPGNVKFERVTFGYNAKKPVLHDLSFEIKGGSVVAIVGPTGAGKTTLVNLISRFYDPQHGRIVIDGMDVRDVTLESLRTQVAFVFQETYLFSDTVEGNIAFGRPKVRGGEVEAAARLAQAHEFIETLPQGYQTILGERGASLSGGQRQRLAIARAILFNPRVLILDDATAAVDPETEDLIRRGMDVVMKDRTTFLIAHRISTVKRADIVLVLERGRISQMGTHDELMATDGHYREIAAVQLYGDEALRDPEGDLPSHMDRMRDPRKVAAPAAPVADPTPSPVAPADTAREGHI